MLQPYVYALTYASSVATFPEAIFVLAACLLYAVVFFLSRISPSEEDIALVHTPRIGQEVMSPSTSGGYAYQSIADIEDEGDGAPRK